jgi:hypothetical protein
MKFTLFIIVLSFAILVRGFAIVSIHDKLAVTAEKLESGASISLQAYKSGEGSSLSTYYSDQLLIYLL